MVEKGVLWCCSAVLRSETANRGVEVGGSEARVSAVDSVRSPNQGVVFGKSVAIHKCACRPYEAEVRCKVHSVAADDHTRVEVEGVASG